MDCHNLGHPNDWPLCRLNIQKKMLKFFFENFLDQGLKIHTIPHGHVITQDWNPIQSLVRWYKKNSKKKKFQRFFFFFWKWLELLHSGRFDTNLVQWAFSTHLLCEETNFHPCCSNSKPIGNELSLVFKNHIGNSYRFLPLFVLMHHYISSKSIFERKN